MGNKNIRYLVYDTETTGLSVKTSGIVQLGFMFLEKVDSRYKILARDSVYCNPLDIDFEDKSVLKALSINHLTVEQVLRSNNEKETLEIFFSLIELYEPNYVIGQNHVAYDNEIVFNRSIKYGIEAECASILLDREHLDTKLYHKALFPGEKNDLKYMCSKFGIDQYNAHDAMCDVDCTWKVFKKLIKADSILDLSCLEKAKKILYKYE